MIAFAMIFERPIDLAVHKDMHQLVVDDVVKIVQRAVRWNHDAAF